jgi:hypothetical protein
MVHIQRAPRSLKAPKKAPVAAEAAVVVVVVVVVEGKGGGFSTASSLQLRCYTTIGIYVRCHVT